MNSFGTFASLAAVAALLATPACSSTTSDPSGVPEATLPGGNMGNVGGGGAGGNVGGGTAGSSGTASSSSGGTEVKGVPFDTKKNEWAFVNVDGAECNDGTPTGVGVYRTDSPNLVVYFQGGGACWDYGSCYILHTATHGPYGQAQFAKDRGFVDESVLSAEAAKSPFATWNKVFIPYCTGDVHSGDNVATYKSDSGTSETWKHVGRRNVQRIMPRISATFTGVTSLAVSGSSAGGYGSFFNYPLVRDAYPSARSILVDDAGPPLDPQAVRPAIRDAFSGQWGSVAAVKDLCAECVTDWPKYVSFLSKRYPSDRLALLSSMQDEIIRQFMSLSATAMETQLRALEKSQFAPSSNARVFFVPGQQHTFLGSPSTTVSGDVHLDAWIASMLTGDPWASVIPAAPTP